MDGALVAVLRLAPNLPAPLWVSERVCDSTLLCVNLPLGVHMCALQAAVCAARDAAAVQQCSCGAMRQPCSCGRAADAPLGQ